MPNHLLDLSLLLQVVESLSRQAAVNLQPIDEGGDRDEAVRLHVLVEFVRGGFVEDDGVVGFVLDWRGGEVSVWGFGVCGREGKGGEKARLSVSFLWTRLWGLPFPLDHFFFCFFPPVAAAGAWQRISF